ncbi:MAG: hypothetical protein ACRCW2_09435 [Cellulosilyticaceae bacterium]
MAKFNFSGFRPIDPGCELPPEDVVFQAGETYKEVILPTKEAYEMTCEGRLLTVSVRLRNICSNKQLAVGVLVYEVINSDLVSRGFKAIQVTTPPPLDPNTLCESLKVGPFEFVLPEADVTLCNARTFRVRVIAHYSNLLEGYRQ